MKNQHFNWKFIFMNFQSVYKQNFKSVITLTKFLYNSHFYYQSSVHTFYSQSYFMSAYSSQSEWSLQEYNSYWENKAQQQDSTFQNSTSWNDQLILSVSKQFLMITADTAAVSESQPVYSNFEWEVNLCCDQDWYKCVTEDQSQSFYST